MLLLHLLSLLRAKLRDKGVCGLKDGRRLSLPPMTSEPPWEGPGVSALARPARAEGHGLGYAPDSLICPAR